MFRLVMAAVLGAVVISSATPAVSQAVSQQEQAVDFKISGDLSTPEARRAATASRQYLERIRDRYAIARPDDLRVKAVAVDESGMRHVRVQQTVDGVPVWHGEAIVHLNKDASVFAFTDSLVKSVRTAVTPNFTKDDILNLARGAAGPRLTGGWQADLWVFRHSGQDHLAYRVRFRRIDPKSQEIELPVIFYDAQTLEQLFEYDNLQTAGSGPTLYSGTVRFGTYGYGPTYYLEDHNRHFGVTDMRNAFDEFETSYRLYDSDNVWGSLSWRPANDVEYGLLKTWDYFSQTYGRRGVDGNDGPGLMTSINGSTRLFNARIHFGRRYNNAFWNGFALYFGDGDNSLFSPTVSLDIVGHEFTHGVTQYTAGLDYFDEPGALNESMSDVFGAMVERFAQGESENTWKIGERCFTPGISGDALRFMDNPHTAGQPDHYSERYVGGDDNGGVHSNSGIANKAFFLLAKGGTHHLGGSMTGIGADAAARIWYTALSNYMTPGTSFAQARVATLNAAAALYGPGSAQYQAVNRSWALCGVS